MHGGLIKRVLAVGTFQILINLAGHGMFGNAVIQYLWRQISVV